METVVKQKRTWRDVLISNFIIGSSFLYESLMLRILRFINRGKYEKLGYDSPNFGKVSIILPTYNRSQILFERAIPSVLSQTYAQWELLVVSHGCTDSTDERIGNLRKHDERVKLISIKRGKLGYPNTAENHWLVGPVKPINAGLRRVSGSWVARIDDDDVWTKDHLELLLQKIVRSKTEFVSSPYQVMDATGTRIVNPEGCPAVGGVQTWLFRSYLSFFRAHLSSWRKSWNRVNDTDIQERMIRAGVTTATIDQVTAHISPRPGEQEIGSKAYLMNSRKYEDNYGASMKSRES